MSREADRRRLAALKRLAERPGTPGEAISGASASAQRVHCLQLGGADLTSAAGKMTMGIMASVAQFERDLLIERTNAGLERAWSEGKRSGRPAALDDDQRAAVREAIAGGKADPLAIKTVAAVLVADAKDSQHCA